MKYINDKILNGRTGVVHLLRGQKGKRRRREGKQMPETRGRIQFVFYFILFFKVNGNDKVKTDEVEPKEQYRNNTQKEKHQEGKYIYIYLRI